MEVRRDDLRLVRLGNPDEALRAIVFFLVRDPAYASARLKAVASLYRSITTGQYLLLCRDDEVVACATWAQISRATLEACLRERREPSVGEIRHPGDVFVASAVSAQTPHLLHRITRALFRACADKDVLFIRHMKGGRPCFRMRVIPQGRGRRAGVPVQT